MSEYLRVERSKVYVTLILGRDEFSSMVREVVEYAVDVARREYGLRVEYRVVFAETSKPCLVINDFKPITLHNIPSISELLSVLVMVADVECAVAVTTRNSGEIPAF